MVSKAMADEPLPRRTMPRTGFEPARDYSHQPLKLARLPIPPPGRFQFTIYYLILTIGPRLHEDTDIIDAGWMIVNSQFPPLFRLTLSLAHCMIYSKLNNRKVNSLWFIDDKAARRESGYQAINRQAIRIAGNQEGKTT